MKISRLYTDWDLFKPIYLDGLTYSIDKIVFTINCGSCSGSDRQFANVKYYLISNGLRCKQANTKYLKYSFNSLDGHIHLEVWRDTLTNRMSRYDEESETQRITYLPVDVMKIRVHINPNRIKEAPRFLDVITADVHRFQHGVCPCVLNRVDYAIDIPDVVPDDLLIISRKHRADCFKDTMYFGTRGIEELKVYNKTVESELDSQLTRMEWEVSHMPLDFVIKEEVTRLSPDVPHYFKFLRPHKVSEALRGYHHETRKKIKNALAREQIHLSNDPIKVLSSNVRSYLYDDLGLIINQDYRTSITDDLKNISLLLNNFKNHAEV